MMLRQLSRRAYHMSSACHGKARKPGVATDAEMTAFLAAADMSKVVVVDTRNPDFEVEPHDLEWGEPGNAGPIAKSALAGDTRPQAVNLVYDRPSKSMDLAALDPHLCPELGKATPIITHCGGGGRGQKGRLFLEAAGFTNVINGGGPTVPELWEKYGAL